MEKSVIYLAITVMSNCFSGCSNKNVPDSDNEGLFQNNIRSCLSGAAAQITDNSFSGINSVADWENEHPLRYQQSLEMMGTRGIDLLTERPEVDKENIGVTGGPGGGGQSWYVPAIAPRIKAVEPVLI